MQINISDNCMNVSYSQRFSMDVPKSRVKVPAHKPERLNEYLDIPNSILEENPKLHLHIANVRYALDNGLSRAYQLLISPTYEKFVYIDNLNDVEKTSLRINGKGKCAILSLEDNLDIVLEYLTGVDSNIVRSIPNYEYISFHCMNCAPQNSTIICDLNVLLGLDKKLDSYFNNLIVKYPNKEDTEKLLLEFYSDITLIATSILEICVDNLLVKNSISIRSQSYSNFVLGYTDNTLDLPEYIDYTDKRVSFRIPIIKCGAGGYKEYLMNQNSIV